MGVAHTKVQSCKNSAFHKPLFSAGDKNTVCQNQGFCNPERWNSWITWWFGWRCWGPFVHDTLIRYTLLKLPRCPPSSPSRLRSELSLVGQKHTETHRQADKPHWPGPMWWNQQAASITWCDLFRPNFGHKTPEIISVHDVWEPWKQALLASRDVIISSQFAAQIWRGFFTLPLDRKW